MYISLFSKLLVGNYCKRVVSQQSSLSNIFLISIQQRNFSRFNRKGRTRIEQNENETKPVVVDTPPPPVKEEWTAVTDEATGQIYYWNERTNETTHLGAPNPNHNSVAPPPQEQSGAPGLGRVVAEGMAFGTGSAIAHNVIGSIFGGFGGGGADDDGGDEGYDI